jgi:hypothetical protein
MRSGKTTNYNPMNIFPMKVAAVMDEGAGGGGSSRSASPPSYAEGLALSPEIV